MKPADLLMLAAVGAVAWYAVRTINGAARPASAYNPRDPQHDARVDPWLARSGSGDYTYRGRVVSPDELANLQEYGV